MIINTFTTFQSFGIVEFSVQIFGIVFIKLSKNAPHLYLFSSESSNESIESFIVMVYVLYVKVILNFYILSRSLSYLCI